MVEINNLIDLEGVANREISSAISFQDAAIRDRQIECLKRYYGLPLGNEVDGQSKVVTRDVLAAVEWMLPPLVRTFAGSSDAVEFVPHGQEDEDIAAQATDYINYIFNNDNNGYRIIYNSLKDGLMVGCGVGKVYYEKEDSWSAPTTYSGLDDAAFSMLVNDPSVEVMEHSEMAGVAVGDLAMGGVVVQPTTHDVTVRHKSTNTKFCVECIPPEEFFVSSDAKGDIEKARCVGNRTQKTVSDLIEMGFDPEIVKDLPQSGSSYDWRALDRTVPNSTQTQDIDDPADDSQQYIWVSEAYIKADVDGDGISECVRVIIAGDNGSGKLLAYELVDGHPYAFWTPIATPHEQYGLSLSELVLDVQNVKTTLLRQTLNNLYLSNVPSVAVVDGAVVNIDAVIDRKPGSVIMVKRPDALMPISIPFTAAQSFGMMDYWDAEADKRTGVSGAQGLDPNMLQNTTAAAVSASMSAQQQRIELIARQYADFMQTIFKKLLVLVVRHQNKERVIRLRNKWTTIDPRNWDAGMDVAINVGLGNGNRDVMAAHLNMIAAKQEQILLQLGPDNPLVGLDQYYNTLVKMVEAVGYKDGAAFFRDPKQYQPQMQEPKPDPKMMEAAQKFELEKAKLLADQQIAKQKLENDLALEHQRMLADIQIAKERGLAELELKRAQMAAEYELKKEQIEKQEPSSDVSVSSSVRLGGEMG